MISRFANPHLTSVLTEKVNRASVFNDNLTFENNAEEEGRNSPVDLDERVELLNHLHKRLHESMDFVAETNKRKKKRMQLSGEPGDDSQKAPQGNSERILFKLTSATEKPILINPPPPKPPSCYREPTYEDSDADALKRRERARAVAVDFDWVMQESRKTQFPFPSWNSRIMDATILKSSDAPPQYEPPAPTDSASSSMMILQRLQPPRKSRPPVPSGTELLMYHPYTVGGPPHPDARKKPHNKVLVLDVLLQQPTQRK
ncbi:hypothetical protein GYMLUDRAFT_42471 [Collybiopsis luxurians FD-317 M1]|uniref:Uncharacterized protein n=1 Tax=Collybiopsis luxurians FD-317 M1 TaxID=944289 RepID=A0A0D0CS26_9AGAR|nr:hypothetical protein GYMLUDRAFT_42471 [Collybiopsis luxurians FD-317 M1]